MIKRIIPFLAVLSLLVSMIVVPASANTDFDIVDYNDYITNTEVDGDNDIVTVTFPLELCGMTTKDMYGNRRWPNQRTQSIYLSHSINTGACGFYVPGSGITTTWIDLTNIPDGSEFSFSGDVLVADSLFYRIECTAWVGMQYYDVNGQSVGSDNVDKVNFQFTGDLERFYTYSDSIVIEKPSNAVYGCFMVMVEVSSDNIQPDGRNAEVYFDYRLPTLKMSISSMYRLQQETGKTNKLLDQIVNDEVTAEPPEDAGAVGDLDSIEDELKDNTAAGREEAEQIFNESSSLIAAHIAGFLFLSDVIERFIGVGWLRGLLTVSLSLGILGFVANIAMVASRNVNLSFGAKKGGKT